MSDLFEPIAVVGIGARFPGAWDARDYWRNLAAARESITALSDEELRAAGVPESRIADPAYVKMAGLIPGADLFDAEFFGMTPREAEICDPQLRLFLEMTHEAIENAGYDSTRMDRDVAVYGACGPARYGELNVLANPRYGAAPDIGLSFLTNLDYLATLASYKLNLRGPSMAVLTACSSSLTAIHLACRSLQFGECDAAVAGAANVDVPYRTGYRWSPGDVRSADGHCRPFDAAATGTIFTSGAGAVLLKRLGDAIADGDHIRAVIHGIGITNDGSDKVSFSAPSVTGQASAILDAMTMAGFGPSDIDCVEMHATGTPLGDPIEVAALDRAYRQLADGAPATGRIPVGSVKSNIGHTVPAAGVAGLLKLVLALEHEQIPPTINVARVNPRLGIEQTPFVVNDRTVPWPRTATRPRRAGLSSLGVGGTNVHLVLEEGPVPAHTPHLERPRVVVWSGRDETARAANQDTLARYFAEAGESTFADATATLHDGRTAHALRGAAVCSTAAEAAQRLGGSGPVLTGEKGVGSGPEVVFAFPGQGSQHARMAAGLYGRQRVFTETVDVCFDLLERHGADLYGLWLAESPGADLNETANTQPLLFAIEYALAQQWVEWGIRPAALLGHSVGELAAAAVAGVLDLDDALRLVVARGRAMQRQSRGGMFVAAAGVGRLRPFLVDGSGVVVAAMNADDQTVLAGSSDDLAKVAGALTAAGIAGRLLHTSHAFHSPAMRPAVEEFQSAFSEVRLRPPEVPVYSAATGGLLTADEAVDPGFWARQLAEPVLFARAVDAATDDADGRVILEVGPGHALTGLVRRHPAVRSGHWPALASGTDERALLETLAELWLRGRQVDWSRVYRDEALQRVSVPGYRFQRRRFWVDPVDSRPALDASATPVSQSAPDAGPYTVPSWVEATRPAPVTAPETATPATALVLLPANEADARPIVDALEAAGYHAVRLRPGSTFGERADEFEVRPAHLAADLERVLAAGAAPTLLVHAWGVGEAATPAEELDRTFFALLDLVQRAGRRPVAGRLPGLLVLTSGAVDVSGGEPVVPERAALVAAARTAGLESPDTECRIIDVEATGPARRLAAELRCGATDPVVALRGSRRWLPVQRPWPAPDGGGTPIRDGGVYVLVGGLGGLGLAVAKGLAATGCHPNLALLARSGADVTEAQAGLLAEIEETGARIRVIRCDVADRPQLERALDEVARVFGAINGVLHLAGVAGGGMLQFRGRADAERVLRPKVLGTTVLADVLAARPPVDFVVCFSSQAALTGMVGSADYAAANAFLDAYAAGRPGWLSVNWPVWTSVGMASGGALDDLAGVLRALRSPDADAPDPAPPASGPWHETVLSAASHWVLDEHRIGSAAVLPGTGLVDLIVASFLDRVPGATGPVTVRDLVFLRPLIGDTPRRTRVCFEPADGLTWRVRVLSTDAGGADSGAEPDAEPGAGAVAWDEHVTGLITAGAAAPPSLPVDQLTAGLDEVAVPSLLPSPGGTFAFGPRWQNIDRMWRTGGTSVVGLVLPPAFAAEAREHAVHPALLDTGTAVLRHTDDSELLVPFLYRSLRWYAPLPARVFSRVRRRPGNEMVADVEFVAPDGTVPVAIDGFQMRRARLADFVATSGATAATPGKPERTVDGLSPDEGVRLLRQLLESATPAQIAVIPHRDGRPIPAGALTDSTPADRPQRPEAGSTPVAAGRTTGTSVEDRLADIWQQLLGRPRVAPEDDFFELGGDSITAVAMTGRIRDAFGVEVSIGSLFDYPNLAALADALREQGAR
jgi:acyl transferase domain-containing protein/acyl carrier protein